MENIDDWRVCRLILQETKVHDGSLVTHDEDQGSRSKDNILLLYVTSIHRYSSSSHSVVETTKHQNPLFHSHKMLGVQPSGGIRSRSLHVPHSERMIHNSYGRRARRRNNRKIESCSGATKFVSLSILVLFSVLVLSAGARSAIQAKRRRNNNHNNKYHDISLGKASNLRGAAIAVDRYPKFNEKDAAKAADHLIVVAGHSVIMPTLPSNNHGCDQKSVIDQKNINNDSRLNYFQEESVRRYCYLMFYLFH